MREVDSRVVPMDAASLKLPKALFEMVSDQVEKSAVHDVDFEFFAIYAERETIFIDVGSNIGNSAVSIANRCPNARIFGFEANKMLEPFLINEAKRNKNYIYKMVGLGEKPGVMDLYIPVIDDNPILGEASIIRSHFSDPVVVDRLNSYSGSHDFTIVKSSCILETLDQQSNLFEAAENATHRVIKIDVEGAELSVLRGCVSFIQTFRPTFMIEDGMRPEVVSFLADRGYSRYIINSENYMPEEASGKDAINSIFVHRHVF